MNPNPDTQLYQQLYQLYQLLQQTHHHLVVQQRVATFSFVVGCVILALLVSNLLMQLKIRKLQAERHEYVRQAIDALFAHQQFLDKRLTAVETGVYLDPGDEGI